MVKGRDFIVFGEDFGRHAHCLEHLMKPLSQTNRIVWVQTAGMRAPNLFRFSDLIRSWSKIRAWFRSEKLQDGTIFVLSPVMIPLHGFKLIRKLNRCLVARALRRVCQKYGLHEPVFVTSIPTNADFIDLGFGLKVYYCVDEFGEWPGLPHNVVKAMETQLLHKADLVLATSEALQESRSGHNRNVRFFPHGVDLEHFRLSPSRLPLAASDTVTVGLFGLIDERIDVRVLEHLLNTDPNLRLRIIGRVVVKHPVFFHPRVERIPQISYQKLPEYLNPIDIFILPYYENALTRNINPLKLREYLATGRPVVASPLPEVQKLKSVFLAKDPREFLEIIQKLKVGQQKYSPVEALRELYPMSWQHRAEEFSQILSCYDRSSRPQG